MRKNGSACPSSLSGGDPGTSDIAVACSLIGHRVAASSKLLVGSSKYKITKRMWHATARRRAARTTHTDTRCLYDTHSDSHTRYTRLRGVGRTDTVPVTSLVGLWSVRHDRAEPSVQCTYTLTITTSGRAHARATNTLTSYNDSASALACMSTRRASARLSASAHAHIPYHQHSRLPCCYDGKVFLLEALVHLDHRRSRRGGRHGLASVSPLAFPLARVDVCARAG